MRRQQAFDSQKNELRSCSTGQEWKRLAFLHSIHNLPCVWSNVFCIWKACALEVLRLDSQWGDLCNGTYIIMIGPEIAQMWSFEAAKQTSTFVLIFSVLKGLSTKENCFVPQTKAEIYKRTALLGRVLQQVWLLCYVVSISKCVFYSMPSPSASVFSMLCRIYQQVWLLCCAVSISKYDFYAVPSLSASVTSMLCHLYQQVWLLCCASLSASITSVLCISISKYDFYAVSSLSASVTSMLCHLHQQVWLLLCRLHHQMWLLYSVDSISKCDFFAASSASAGVTSMLCRVRQQVCLLCCAVFVSKPSCQMCEDTVKLTWLFNIPEHNRQSRLDLCNCQFHGQSPIVRHCSVWRLDFVHETDSYTNLSDFVCCVQLLFLDSFIKSRNWAL